MPRLHLAIAAALRIAMPTVLPLALPIALPIALGGCFERVTPTLESSIRPVQAIKVALAPVGTSRDYAGIVRPRHEADIGFRTGGRILARSVDVGTRVTQGQELARLDPIDLTLAVRSAEANLASAEANRWQAEADAARSAVLAKQGWNAAATDEVKQAVSRAAIQRVASASAALALAHNQLDYAVLQAPSDGVITAVLADPGTVIAEGQPVFRLADSSTLEAEVALPEAALPGARTTDATVTLWAHPDTTLHARLRELSPSADPKLRTYTARYTIVDPPAWLAMGMSTTVHLGGTASAPVATLPASALADRGTGPVVWVIDPASGTITPRPVTVQSLGRDSAAVQGLTDGELVVAMGVQKLDPAGRVRIADLRPIRE